MYFENAVNSSPSTDLSLISDISNDYSSESKSSADLKRILFEKKYTHTPGSKIENTYQYGYGSEFRIQRLRLNSTTYLNETFDFFKYPIARVFSPFVLKTLEWHRFDRFKNAIGLPEYEYPLEVQNLVDEMKANGIHSWSRDRRLHIQVFLSSASLSETWVEALVLIYTLAYSVQ